MYPSSLKVEVLLVLVLVPLIENSVSNPELPSKGTEILDHPPSVAEDSLMPLAMHPSSMDYLDVVLSRHLLVHELHEYASDMLDDPSMRDIGGSIPVAEDPCSMDHLSMDISNHNVID